MDFLYAVTQPPAVGAPSKRVQLAERHAGWDRRPFEFASGGHVSGLPPRLMTDDLLMNFFRRGTASVGFRPAEDSPVTASEFGSCHPALPNPGEPLVMPTTHFASARMGQFGDGLVQGRRRIPSPSHVLCSPPDDAAEVFADGDLAGVAAAAYVGLEQGGAGGVGGGRDQVGEDEVAHACLFGQRAEGVGVGVVVATR
jgi:hypothetical protein